MKGNAYSQNKWVSVCGWRFRSYSTDPHTFSSLSREMWVADTAKSQSPAKCLLSWWTLCSNFDRKWNISSLKFLLVMYLVTWTRKENHEPKSNKDISLISSKKLRISDQNNGEQYSSKFYFTVSFFNPAIALKLENCWLKERPDFKQRNSETLRWFPHFSSLRCLQPFTQVTVLLGTEKSDILTKLFLAINIDDLTITLW